MFSLSHDNFFLDLSSTQDEARVAFADGELFASRFTESCFGIDLRPSLTSDKISNEGEKALAKTFDGVNHKVFSAA